MTLNPQDYPLLRKALSKSHSAEEVDAIIRALEPGYARELEELCALGPEELVRVAEQSALSEAEWPTEQRDAVWFAIARDLGL